MEKHYIVHIGCGETFDEIETAADHLVYCGIYDLGLESENEFRILPESEAL